MKVVTEYWINPLTGSHVMPSAPGDIITAAIALWEDQIMEQRDRKYLRKPADKLDRESRIAEAASRLHRFRAEREHVTTKRANKMTLELATNDLRKVMK